MGDHRLMKNRDSTQNPRRGSTYMKLAGRKWISWWAIAGLVVPTLLPLNWLVLGHGFGKLKVSLRAEFDPYDGAPKSPKGLHHPVRGSSIWGGTQASLKPPTDEF